MALAALPARHPGLTYSSWGSGVSRGSLPTELTTGSVVVVEAVSSCPVAASSPSPRVGVLVTRVPTDVLQEEEVRSLVK